MRSHQGGPGLVDFGSDPDMVNSQSVPIPVGEQRFPTIKIAFRPSNRAENPAIFIVIP